MAAPETGGDLSRMVDDALAPLGTWDDQVRAFLADTRPAVAYGTRRDRHECRTCSHQRVAHTHYTASTHCGSGCGCRAFRRSRTRWALPALAAACCATWAAVGWLIARAVGA